MYLSGVSFLKIQFVSANNTRKKTLELCFLTVCFDVNCSCVNATTNINPDLRLGDTSLHCKILNTRMNEAKNELEKQNATQKTGMLHVCRLYNRLVLRKLLCVNVYLMKVLIN